jgi:hypothetical protein
VSGFNFVNVDYEDVPVVDDDGIWLVPQVVCDSKTLLFGEPKSGKSAVAGGLAAAIATGGEFAGRPVNGGPKRVGIAWTDDRNDREYRSRMAKTYGMERLNIGFTPLRTMTGPRMWEAFGDHCIAEGYEVLILDNMSRAANGDLNTLPGVREFFDGLDPVVADLGIPTVLISHSSSKTGQNGYKANTPQGRTEITAFVRWHGHVTRHGNSAMTVHFEGNPAPGYDLKIRRDEDGGIGFTDRGTLNAAELENELDKQRQKRDAKTYEQNRKYAQHVHDKCQGMSLAVAAESLAAAFPGDGLAPGTYEGRLSHRKGVPGPIRAQLDPLPGKCWAWAQG